MRHTDTLWQGPSGPWEPRSGDHREAGLKAPQGSVTGLFGFLDFFKFFFQKKKRKKKVL
jgi:hypothetical protein